MIFLSIVDTLNFLCHVKGVGGQSAALFFQLHPSLVQACAELPNNEIGMLFFSILLNICH